MTLPYVTVLMPVYNAELYLSEAIESILNQTFSDFEFLIINDGSTDKSEGIILSYIDQRIRYIKNETNLKLITTLNKGIELAKGKYIVRMDADDISLPERLQTQINFMEAHPNVAVCGSWFEVLDKKSSVAKYVSEHREIMMKMLYQCHLCHPSVIMRKTMLDSFSIKFDMHFTHAEDYDFFIRVGEKFELANIQQILLKYRIHEQNVSKQNKDIQQQNSLLIKQNLFKKIGLAVTENEIDLFRKIMQYEYEQTENFVDNAKIFLENLLLANERTAFFEKDFFKNYLMQLWYNVAYNTTSLGTITIVKYKSSSSLRYSFIHLLNLYTKAFFKR